MKRKQEIENSINHLTCILNKLRTKIDESEDYNAAYNRLLIKRAELRKKMNCTPASAVIDIFKEKILYLKPGYKEKLICDYFNSMKI